MLNRRAANARAARSRRFCVAADDSTRPPNGCSQELRVRNARPSAVQSRSTALRRTLRAAQTKCARRFAERISIRFAASPAVSTRQRGASNGDCFARRLGSAITRHCFQRRAIDDRGRRVRFFRSFSVLRPCPSSFFHRPKNRVSHCHQSNVGVVARNDESVTAVGTLLSLSTTMS